MHYSLPRQTYTVLLLFLFLTLFSSAQDFESRPNSTWKGFTQINFFIEGHPAYYVKPANPLPGNPWIWRASFPDWHTDIDSMLLAKGFFVAYISFDNQYGTPAAMQVWDQFYNYLTDSLHFSIKVALEAVSRGGLYAYAWAKRNPQKINCIYAEAPVCDIKSWPGGRGTGIGDSASWHQLLSVYHLNEEEALAFNDNPTDDLEGLAAFKVPVIHIVSPTDKVVPVAENSAVLTTRYNHLGGPVMIYPVTTGAIELNGHHFPIAHPQQWAAIIAAYCYPVTNLLPTSNYSVLRAGLKNSYSVITNRKTATVAFLGGSITYNPGWRGKVSRYLQERFPLTRFRFIAAGIPSLGSLPHAFRLQRDILDSGVIDLLFIEAAVNDRANATDSLLQLQSLEGIVRHAKLSNPQMDIVMMSFADPEKTSDYIQGVIPVEIKNHELIAAHYQLPSINLAKEMHDRMVAHEFSWDDDFRDLHPSPFGQELYFAAIKKLLQQGYGHAKADKSATKIPPALNSTAFVNGKYVPVTNAKYQHGFTISPDWVPADSLATREGFVHVPVLETNQAGAELTFDFNGTAVGIAIVSGADAGVISYQVDQLPAQKLDLFTQWSGQLHLPWYVMLGTGLKNTHHVLRLAVTDSKNSHSTGHACRIVHFLVNDPQRSSPKKSAF